MTLVIMLQIVNIKPGTLNSGDRGAGRKRTHGEEPFMEDVQKKVTQNMASYVS